MKLFNIGNIGIKGASPDVEPYNLEEGYVTKAHNMRYQRDGLEAARQSMKLIFTFDGTNNPVTVGEAYLDAIWFNKHLWLVKYDDDQFEIVRCYYSSGAMKATVVNGPYNRFIEARKGISRYFLRVNNSLLFCGNGIAPRILSSLEYDGTENITPAGDVLLLNNYQDHDHEDPASDPGAYAAIWYGYAMGTYKNFFYQIRPTTIAEVNNDPNIYNYPEKSNTVIWSDLIPYQLDEDGPWWLSTSTNLAGENILTAQHGALVEARELDDRLVIYGTSGVWTMSFVGGNSVFAFDGIFTYEGAMNEGAVTEIPDAQHAVMGNANFYLHNGVNKTYPADGRVRKALFDFNSRTERTQVVYVPSTKEVIVLPASLGLADTPYAWVYNVRYDAWTTLDKTALCPGANQVNAARVTPFDDSDPAHWVYFQCGTFDYGGKGLMLCTDKGIYLDPHSVDEPEISPTLAPFELEYTLTDFSQITGEPSAYRHFWMHSILPQMSGKGDINLDVTCYPELGWNVTPNHQKTIVIPTEQIPRVNIDLPARYVTLRFYRDTTSTDGNFVLRAITGEVSPQTYTF